MEKVFIDCDGGAFGRICSLAAKEALKGKEVIMLNCEKAIISGNKENIIKKYLKLRKLGGTSRKKPIYPKVPYLLVKRCIGGMLPNYRRGFGKQVFSRIKCYNGFPEEFRNEKIVKTNLKSYDKFIELKELCERI